VGDELTKGGWVVVADLEQASSVWVCWRGGGEQGVWERGRDIIKKVGLLD
jgi:hypothetical protein